jgi:hypothetical protein
MGTVEASAVSASMNPVLALRVGEFVEVRSEEEILRTLDSRGTLDSLPFMPEMLPFCGKRFRVYKRADKACDTIDWGTPRRMKDAVHLEGLRCNGAAHGGCQAACLIYWKEAWLKRVVGPSNASTPIEPVEIAGSQEGVAACTRETLMDATRREADSEEEVFSCQATELLRATTSPVPWWEPGQYVRDVRSGNASVGRVIRGLFVGLFNKVQKANVRLFPRFTLIHGARTYPFVLGESTSRTPSGSLNLQPGDLVEVKSKDEIFKTLDERDRTRGLRFDGEMLKYCGRRGRVSHRVEKIINEKTGKMHLINSDCIVIEGFVCTGDYHRSCPRSIYPYWRESWLKRASEPVEAGRDETA